METPPSRREARAREAGFTLVETVVASAIVAAFVLAAISTLAGRAGSFETSRTEVTTFLAYARAAALANGNAGTAGGATIRVQYDPAPDDATTLRLFLGRPGPDAAPSPAANVAPLRVTGKLALTSSTPETGGANAFGLFINASGASSARAGYAFEAHADDPACDPATGVRMSLSTTSRTEPIVIDCMTGDILPVPPRGDVPPGDAPPGDAPAGDARAAGASNAPSDRGAAIH